MEFLNTITNYFANGPSRFAKKTLFGIFILIIFLFVDRMFSFSYYYNTSRKISQTMELNKVLESDQLSPTDTRKIHQLQSEILNRKGPFEYVTRSTFEITFSNSKDPRNSILHFLSSTYFFLGVIATILFLGFKKDRGNLDYIIGLVFIFVPLIFFCAWLVAWMFSYIPLVYSPWINYMINIILCTMAGSYIFLYLPKVVVKLEEEKEKERRDKAAAIRKNQLDNLMKNIASRKRKL